jgi:hypothetical protein
VHRTATQILSTAMLLIGIAMIVVVFAAGGGLLSRGLIFGVLFIAAGAGRLWVARQSVRR